MVEIDANNMGPRPAFFSDPAIDQVMAIVLAMSAELSVVYDRLDSVERVLERKKLVQRDEVESYRPDDTVQSERATRHKEYLRRIFRILRGDALVPHDEMHDYEELRKKLSAQGQGA